MEKRKESLSALKICRFCLCQGNSLSNLYDRTRKPKNAVPLSLKILSSVSIEVFPSDKMPPYICNRCRFFMEICYEYKQICHQTDETILNFIQNGTAMENIPWPSQLNKLYNSATKTLAKPTVVKQVVEGGATVQVASHEEYESEEEDDENVFNIKIDELEDGSKDVKVITSKNESKFVKEITPRKALVSYRAGSDGEAASKNMNQTQTRWPCNLCYCTYPLKQLLELHKVQKHRARTVSCDQCNAKFFTKQSLNIHMLVHSEEKPFECLACGRKFRRLVLMRSHEKLMHSDLHRYSCTYCTSSFLSQEELEAHQNRHINVTKRRHPCQLCEKRFVDKTTLQRHIQVIHEKKHGYRCEYCQERFSSISKLTRHLRTHTGERAYPCKYCNKSFVKSQHYTRHLRLKHRVAIRNSRGPFGQVNQYRCEQCEDSFTTQDELIYHSAIHATQNLTCPLCQEKFENVDAVTAHIKSHVNGIEFMCDLCELVFTTKEKLDNHLTMAHDDELRNSQDSSMEMDGEEDDDDNVINVKEEDDHVVVEIKKAENFMLDSSQAEAEGKTNDNTISDDSESETIYTELATVDTLAVMRKESPVKVLEKVSVKQPSTASLIASPTPVTAVTPTVATAKTDNNQTASILRKAEEIKRKVQQSSIEINKVSNKEKPNNKVESTNTVGASDKSLRLLEKELQDLKRTNSRNEPGKTPAKNVEMLRTRRPQIHTSTPKQRVVEEKKPQSTTKAIEKKTVPERRVVTKENKEPKDTKDVKTNNSNVKENNEKDVKEKDTSKSVIKNGASDKSNTEENVRRSTRPSKIKDYAKMIRDRTQDSEDEDSDMDDEEYDGEKMSDSRNKSRRNSKPLPKPSPVITPSPATAVATQPKKRGRPRKDQSKEVPNKIKKEDIPPEEDQKQKKIEIENNKSKKSPSPSKDDVNEEEACDPVENNANETIADGETRAPSNIIVSPTGQTLKKVPIKALPPGVKPLPLPATARRTGELCEMQIGKKMVKVQKIVMTKAEVEAMAKKGLVEMKDGTMVLKQGIKLPTADPLTLKSTLVGEKEAAKDSSVKKVKLQMDECDI